MVFCETFGECSVCFTNIVFRAEVAGDDVDDVGGLAVERRIDLKLTFGSGDGRWVVDVGASFAAALFACGVASLLVGFGGLQDRMDEMVPNGFVLFECCER